MHHAVPQRARDQGVLGSSDRAEQQRARLKSAEVVPVALLHGVHREQVDGARRDQPQHLRAFEVEAVGSGAVDRRAQVSQRAEDQVALVNGRHLSAP